MCTLITVACVSAANLLLDYGDFLVHIFSERQRAFYDIERLWSDADSETVTG